MMKLYDYPGAPNPRRVKIFAEEKNILLELINCDMAKREHKTPEFLKKNPSGKIPVLELEDGRCISESIPICRYLESLVPEPNLFGEDPFEIAHIESRNRHIELELWTQIGISWVNGPIVGSMGLFEQIPDAKKASEEARIDIRTYKIIYEIVNDIENVMSGMYTKSLVETKVGEAEVREVFKFSKVEIGRAHV